jgi:hypothetical protein
MLHNTVLAVGKEAAPPFRECVEPCRCYGNEEQQSKLKRNLETKLLHVVYIVFVA